MHKNYLLGSKDKQKHEKPDIDKKSTGISKRNPIELKFYVLPPGTTIL